jgi:hypothetical protein
MTNQYEPCFQLFQSINAAVGDTGTVRMINGQDYASVVATFRLDDTKSDIFNDVIGKVMDDPTFQKSTKITLDPDPDNTIFVKFVCSFKW